MKKTLLIAVCMLTMLAGRGFAQTPSTQGKEFWVALTPSQAAGEDKESVQKPTSSNAFEPYIAISSLKACTVKISNPNTTWSEIVTVNKESWTEIKDIPVDKWYTTAGMPQSETKYDLGLKIEATEEVSIFCALRWSQSFDASNILPISALQSEYIIQTYGPTSASNGHHSSVFTILATEDCTVDIIPSVKTKSGKAANSSFNIQLKSGQIYHVFSDTNSDLSGSHVVARDGKKIAIFSGCPATRIPNDFSDRDLLYEQLFPVDYWGKEFIVTRSMQKDANRVTITAQEDNTEITIYGNYQATAQESDLTTLKDYKFTLNSGETYEFELSAGNGKSRWDNKRANNFKGITIIDSTAYIKASCPCAVISYDTGNSYKRKDNTELYNEDKDYYGAPAMTWVSPVEQMINDVVFGLMGTNKTNRHFVNIITTTDNVPSMKMNGISLDSYFKPVDSNSDYSYMRYHFSTTSGFYHLQGDKGFMATVYGNGDDESYAYSVGSAAIKQGIKVGDYVLTEGVINNVTYCAGEELDFNAEVTSSYTVDEVDWDFGDGVSILNSKDIQTTHTYESPGWYDLNVKVRAHKECPYGTYPDINIKVSFRVEKTDTVRMQGIHECINEEDAERGIEYPILKTEYEKIDCSRVEATPIEIGLITKHTVQEEIVGQDSCYWLGKWYFESSEYTDTIAGGNSMNCDSIVTANIRIIACLDMTIELEEDTLCANDNGQLRILYNIKKGEFSSAWLLLENGKRLPLEYNTEAFYISLSELPVDIYHCQLVAEDSYCGQEWSTPLSFVIRYSSTVFRQKWDDVLVVPNSNANGGFEFTSYQWLKNGKTIQGATSAWYYAPDYDETNGKLDMNAEYSVILTRNDGVTIESCSMTPQSQTDGKSQIMVAPTMLMPRDNIHIQTEGIATAEIFSTMGTKEAEVTFDSETHISAPAQYGIYVLHITLEDGTKESRQIVVAK